jgi:hypothetical protein
MKISWGYKIIIAYGLFVAGILALVLLSSQQNQDLVSEEYYADELAYQDIIDKSTHTASLSSPIKIVQSSNRLIIDLPAEFDKKMSKGSWTLYYAASIEKDVKGAFQINDGLLNIEIPATASGNYLLKIEWTSGGLAYYYEKQVYL